MGFISGNRIFLLVSAVAVAVITLIMTDYLRVRKIEPDMEEFSRSRNILRASALVAEGSGAYQKAYLQKDFASLDKAVKSFDNALYYLKYAGEDISGCMDSVKSGLESYLGSFYGGADLLTEEFASDIGRFSSFSSRCMEQAETAGWSGIASYMADIKTEHRRADRLMIAFSFVISFLFISLLWLYTANSKNLGKLRKERTFKYRLLDMLPTMVSVTDGRRMITCNKRVLDFLNFASVEDFQKKHDCLCEFFLNEPGYIFHREDDPWLNQVYRNDENGHESKVKMRDTATGKSRVLLINHSSFDPSEGTLAITFTDITEIERMRLYLKESENKFRVLFNGHSAVMLLIDPETKLIRDANAAAVNFYGYSLERLKNMHICDINIDPKAECRMSEALRGERNSFEFRHMLSGGEIKDVSVFSSPVNIEGREYLFSIITDISDRKLVERELEQQTELLRAVLKNAPVWIWFVSGDGSLKIANDAFCGATGIGESEVCGLRRYYEKMPAGFEQLTEDDMDTLLNSGFSVRECGVQLSDGSRLYLNVTKVRVKCPSGLNSGLICIATDMTEQKSLEKELRRINEYLAESVEKELAVRLGNEMKLKGVFNSINDAMIIFAVNKDGAPGRIIDVNNRLLQLTGRSRHEVHTMHPDELYEAQELAAGMDIGRLVSEGKHFIYESRLKKASGGFVTVEVSSSYVEINGTPLCIVSMRDIDSLIRLEKEKKDSETLTEATFNAAGVGICLSDDTGVLCKVNNTFANMHEYSAEELTGAHYSMLVSVKCREKVVGEIAEFAKGAAGHFSSEHVDVTSSGREILVSVYVTKIRLGEKIMFVTSVQDITGLKRLEEIREVQEQMLIQQSKMAAMGEMIGVIAHQWKQPLNVIYIMAQYLSELTDGSDEEKEKELPEISEGIMKQVEFMNETMNNFRSFFKPGKEPEIFGIEPAVEEIVEMLTPQLRQSDINVKVLIDGEHSVRGFRNEFKQVIMNIISNARDAVIQRRETDGEFFSGKINIDIRRDEDNIALTVCDNGGGIHGDILDELFKPYVTTKGDKGTGIGLSTAKTIIEEKMDGTITAYNTGKGACFTVYLPEYCERQA
ncbi:MAG: PAS domain S-box protein [Deferribacterales bacterium]